MSSSALRLLAARRPRIVTPVRLGIAHLGNSAATLGGSSGGRMPAASSYERSESHGQRNDRSSHDSASGRSSAAKHSFNILSLDGGGVRGAFTASCLLRLEQEVRQQLAFDHQFVEHVIKSPLNKRKEAIPYMACMSVFHKMGSTCLFFRCLAFWTAST